MTQDTGKLQHALGYTFQDPALLQTALTHSSYSREHGGQMQSNERLEFLGDAFFDAIIGEELYRLFPARKKACSPGSARPSSVRNHWPRRPAGWTWAHF